MTTTIILVRHGETDWNRQERFRGRNDIPLNQTGVQQAKLTAQYIAAHWKPIAVYSSPLSRALVTAQTIADSLGLSTTANPGLYDTNYGDWQGLTPAEASRQWPDLISQWYLAPQKITIPGGESLVEVRNRSMKVVDRLVLGTGNADSTIVLVSHTDVIRLILMAILDIEIDRFWHLRQDNCAISVVENTDGNYVVRSMNCTNHLHLNSS